MVMIGDIVEIAWRRGQRWVVAKLDHDGARLRRMEGERLIGFTASPLSLVVISHPTFAEGETVKCNDQEGTVIEDRGGDATVKVKGPDRLPVRGGAFHVTGFWGGAFDADRADLVLDNRKV
jgi:hypothetical protein